MLYYLVFQCYFTYHLFFRVVINFSFNLLAVLTNLIVIAVSLIPTSVIQSYIYTYTHIYVYMYAKTTKNNKN